MFISPYEHHSNILPWLEIGAEVRANPRANYEIMLEKVGLYCFKHRGCVFKKYYFVVLAAYEIAFKHIKYNGRFHATVKFTISNILN